MAKAQIIVVDQRGNWMWPGTWAAWAIKIWQWVFCGMLWDQAKYNHLAVLCENSGMIVELDPVVKLINVDQYPNKWEKSPWSCLCRATEADVLRSATTLKYRYSLMMIAVHIPVIGNVIRKIWPDPTSHGHNCVSFAVAITGMDFDKSLFEPGFFVR